MRLWHKDLIPVLPRQQLLSQWRECCCIARNIAVNGTPNHLLVNKVLDYPLEHFCRYGFRVFKEMIRRGYKADWNKFSKWFKGFGFLSSEYEGDLLYATWHTDRYLLQCYYNMQEKYDCGGIPDDEWEKVELFMEVRK